MKDFRQLKVWDKAHQLTLAAYRSTQGFPSDERFGLTSQIRRCCASIPANIAEGCGRVSDGDFQRFLQIAMGSASELDYHLLLARDLGYLTKSAYDDLAAQLHEVKSMLAPLIRKVRSAHASGD
jgi:four helix bundle protein